MREFEGSDRFKRCLYCSKELSGRKDKKYCDQHCRAASNNQVKKNSENSIYQTILRYLKMNRKVLSKFNKGGVTTIEAELLINEGFDPNVFTHFGESQDGEWSRFCFEFEFSNFIEFGREKFRIVKH